MLSVKGFLVRLAFPILTCFAYTGPAYAGLDANGCLPDGSCYISVNSPQFFGDGTNGGLIGTSSTSSINGKVVIQEKNLCPISHRGGDLYQVQELDHLSVRPVIQDKGGLYFQRYFPPGTFSPGQVTYGPSSIPDTFPLVTISGLKSTSAYAFIWGQVCYYRSCSCPPNSNCLCEFNAAFSELLINTPTNCNPTLSLTLSNSKVGPAKTSIPNITTVTAQLTDSHNSPDCVGGKIIQFTSQAVELSGGHNHSGGRPTGTFDHSSCQTGPDGKCSPVIYSASEVGGVEKISATFAGTPLQQVSTELKVQVSPLVNLDAGPIAFFGVLSSTIYDLVGNLDDHPANHFLDAITNVAIFGIAYDFHNEFHAKLQLNDMSLEHGGLFDIGPHISNERGGPMPYWGSPHGLHRVGRSVDVERCAKSVIPNNLDQGSCSAGLVEVPKLDEFQELCNNWGGYLVNEAAIHCQFSKRGQQ